MLEEGMRCEPGGVWGYGHAASVLYVYLEQRTFLCRVLGLQLCRVLSNCGSAWGFWRVVCVVRLRVYSRGMGTWRHICWGYAIVVFGRDMLGLYMWGSGYVCF